MQVIVDFDSCDSTGLCAELAPAVFRLDERDHLQVDGGRVPEEHWHAVEEAVRACPKLAISLTDRS